MTVNVASDALKKGVDLISGAVASRPTVPATGCIKIETLEGGLVRLAANNLETALAVLVGAKVSANLAIAIPAKEFADIVRELPADRVELTPAQGMALALKSGGFRGTLKGLDAAEFPLVQSCDKSRAVQLDTAAMLAALKEILFSVAPEADEARPVLHNVQLIVSAEKPMLMVLVTTDGFRMSIRAIVLPQPAPAMNVLVPAKSMVQVQKVFDPAEPLQLWLPEERRQIGFAQESVTLVSQLSEGTFPDYSAVVPKTFSTRTTIPLVEFKKAAKLADIMAREVGHAGQLKVTLTEPGQGVLTISATAAEKGENAMEVPVKVEGEPIEIGFNTKYLVDVLNVLEAQGVVLETQAPNKPGVISGAGRRDFRYVLMPLTRGGNGNGNSAAVVGAPATAVPVAAADVPAPVAA